jgi:streptomycin 6-kinase
MELPAVFTDRVRATWPEEGEAWLAALPGLLAETRARWSLDTPRVQDPLSYNYVEFVTGPAGRALVLKAGVPREESRTEIAALRHWDGRGAVRVVAEDEDAGLLLMERLVPGETLVSVADDSEATAIAADLMRELHRAGSADGPFPAVERWGLGFERYRRAHGRGGPLEAGLVDAGEAEYQRLCATQGERVLLHGDLHHENILRSGAGWACIDPKGVIGEREYECCALMRNPESLYARPDALEISRRRLAQLCSALGFEPERVWRWAFAQAVLSACWCVEDGQDHALALQAAGWYRESHEGPANGR